MLYTSMEAIYRKKDIDKLERIQRRATKTIPALRDLSYESRLLQCGLTTLESRRLRGDQIEVLKMVNGYEDVDRNIFFKLKEGSRTRGHKAALVKEQCRLDMRKCPFSQRVINEWNKTNCIDLTKQPQTAGTVLRGYPRACAWIYASSVLAMTAVDLQLRRVVQ